MKKNEKLALILKLILYIPLVAGVIFVIFCLIFADILEKT